MKPIGEGVFTPESIRYRTVILCLNCVRNIAYITAIANKVRGNSLFYQTILNNFVDVATLEWCKIFADKKGKHYWEKSITDKKERDTFYERLLLDLNLNNEEFECHIKRAKQYRDKFVAHLDKENRFSIPDFEHAKKATGFLYTYLIENCEFSPSMNVEQFPTFSEYYSECGKQGREAVI